ncbi:MAG: Holliday junction branch migration protein RuvA [Rhodothermia bacterium]|nr:MAG: Holliday junction branch migration protein RuvA [Rhodothermia bacterium]
MIDYVSGKLSSKKPTEAVIDVSGLGYKLLIPTSTYEKLPKAGEDVRLQCHHYVRDDAILLFGFATDEERSVFNLLLGVSGIGPKLALAALSALSPEEIGTRIVDGDAAMLTQIPGVGRKTAERLIVELRDRFEKLVLTGSKGAESGNGSTARSDAMAALEALGLSRAGADKSLRGVLSKHPEAASAEEMIRLALRQ